MAPIARPETARGTPRHLWVPRQHGAWAMLLLPILLGVAASRPDAWQVVLAGAALTAYLASTSLQAWSRARRAPAYRPPILLYGGAFAVLGVALAVAFPALLLVLVVALPAAAIVFAGARPGTRRDLANSLAQVVQALVLVPAAAWVSGDVDAASVVAYTLVAAGYLLGSVLVVRSVLRERGNAAFAALSIGFHAALLVGAVVAAALPVASPGFAPLAAGLALRATALPLVERRLASGPNPLRPIHVGVVEIVASFAVVVTAFVART